jgi:hypothetical protein
MPLDESAKQIDLVSRVDLCTKLGAEAWLTLGVGQKRRIGQGCAWSTVLELDHHSRCRGTAEAQQLAWRNEHFVTERLEVANELVDDGCPLPRVAGGAKDSVKELGDMTSQDCWLVGLVDYGLGGRVGDIAELVCQLTRDEGLVEPVLHDGPPVGT